MSEKNGKKGFFTEFKEFISKGNIFDMAVGVIIGNSFKAIITALTDQILMPAITYLLGNKSVSDFKTVLKPAALDPATGEVTAESAIYWGSFIQAVVDFLIVALVLFIMIKAAMMVNRKRLELAEKLLKKKAEEAPTEPEAPAEPTMEEKNNALLTEIRDLLDRSVNGK